MTLITALRKGISPDKLYADCPRCKAISLVKDGKIVRKGCKHLDKITEEEIKWE